MNVARRRGALRRAAVGALALAWLVAHASPVVATEPSALHWRPASQSAAVSVDSSGVSLDMAFAIDLASPLTLDVALAVDTPGDAAALWVGTRRQLLGGPRGLFGTVAAAAGVVVPLVAAGAGLGIDAAALGGWRGQRVEFALGLVVPAVFAWQDGLAWRLPARVEALVRSHLGPLTLGMRVGGGLLWGGQGGAAVDLRAGVVIGLGDDPTRDDDALATASSPSLPAQATASAR